MEAGGEKSWGKVGNDNKTPVTEFLNKLPYIWIVGSGERIEEPIRLLWVDIPGTYCKDPDTFYVPGSKAPSEENSK